MGFTRFTRIEELKGGKPASDTPHDLASFNDGPRGRQFHHHIPGRNDDQAANGGLGRPQHPQNGAVQGARNPLGRIPAIKSQQGEKHLDDGFQRLAVAFDGQVPVHIFL